MWEGRCAISSRCLLSDYTGDITGLKVPFIVYKTFDQDLCRRAGSDQAGVTTRLDWSHIGNSATYGHGHRGEKNPGSSGVYAWRRSGGHSQFPGDIRRLRPNISHR
jgi:hypothetical protein